MAKKETADTLQELKAAIKSGEPGRLYVFYGEEVFLLRHYLEQLKKAVIEELTESFNYHRFQQENFDLQAFADAVENLPMMAQRTLVQVDETDVFKLSEEQRNKVAEILLDIPDYCTVVFTYETVAWKPDKRFKKLWEPFEKQGKLVEFAKQNQRDLVAWITRHFAASKKTISSELCTYLIDITDGTMTSLSSEISKIVAFSGADAICKADIDAVTEPVLDAVVFRMTDQLANGSYPEALLTLQKLLKMQQDPIAILGAIGSQYRKLSTARVLLDQGRGYGELMRLYGISDYPAKKSMEAARKCSPRYLATASLLILEADHNMKTSFDEPQRLLEMLVLQLAMEAKNA